jgi:hypothetical protein
MKTGDTNRREATKMPRRMASSGKAQKYPMIAIAIMHQPILSCIARAMFDPPDPTIRHLSP